MNLANVPAQGRRGGEALSTNLAGAGLLLRVDPLVREVVVRSRQNLGALLTLVHRRTVQVDLYCGELLSPGFLHAGVQLAGRRFWCFLGLDGRLDVHGDHPGVFQLKISGKK